MKKNPKIYFKKNSGGTMCNLKNFPLSEAFIFENWKAINEEFRKVNKNQVAGTNPKPALVSCQGNIFDKVRADLGIKVGVNIINFFFHTSNAHFVSIQRK